MIASYLKIESAPVPVAMALAHGLPFALRGAAALMTLGLMYVVAHTHHALRLLRRLAA